MKERKAMITPVFVTFTGADDRTDVTRMDEIARRWVGADGQPLVEWGILFSHSNRDARYPCKQAVDEMLGAAGRKAAHLCGGHGRNVSLFGKVDPAVPLGRFGRCQVNGRDVDRDNLRGVAERHGVSAIVQTQAPAFPDDDRCGFLFDASGGNGVFPDAVPPRPGFLVGYAGGMGPDTVARYLGMIEAAGGDGAFWIDMEGKLRRGGWFDLDAVERVLDAVYGG
jgi:hypothetical protein